MAETATTGKRRYRMRARADRSEATAARLRAEALERFATRPYDEVTLAEIARAAGVTVPTLIAHFGRKEDLFIAACLERGDRIADERGAAPVGDHPGAVRNLFDSYELEGDRVLHLVAEESRVPAIRRITDEGRDYHRAWVERVFAPVIAAEKGLARERLLAQLIVATDLLTWKLLRREMGLSRARAEAAVVGLLDALARGG